MDHRLLHLELERAESLLGELRDLRVLGELREDQLSLVTAMETCLETLEIIKAELQSEFDSQPRKALGRNIKRAITGDRFAKEKLRDLQQVNNVMDSLKISRLSMRAERSEATLKHLEQKIEILMEQQKQQFKYLDTLHQDSYRPASDEESYVKSTISRSDSNTSNSPWQEPDEDNILQKLSTLSIMGLDILADVLECEDYFELSNRLRVWGLGIVNGPFAIGKLDVLKVPFLRILFNIEYIVTRLQANEKKLLAFLKASEKLIDFATSKGLGEVLAINDTLKLAEGKDIGEGISASTKSISDEIETLFERLPGIRSERKTFLSARAQGIRPARTPDNQRRLLAEETVEVARELTNLLRQKAREETPKKEKSLTDHISRLFEEETQRLAEWEKSQPATTNEIATELSELKNSLSEQVTILYNNELHGPNDGLSSTLNDFQTRVNSLSTISRAQEKNKSLDQTKTYHKGKHIATDIQLPNLATAHLFPRSLCNLTETLPGIPCRELNDPQKEEDRGWELYRAMPNWSGRRDIPRGAVLHNSLKERLEKVDSYRPLDNHGSGEPCLWNSKGVADMRDVTYQHLDQSGQEIKSAEWDSRHKIWQFEDFYAQLACSSWYLLKCRGFSESRGTVVIIILSPWHDKFVHLTMIHKPVSCEELKLILLGPFQIDS